MTDLFDFVTARVATGQALQSASDVDALVSAGITHVVDCRAEFDDGPLLAARLTYLWAPTPDDGAPKPTEWFAPAYSFALSALAQPRTKILAHCAGGVNRGPSMAYGILVCLGLDPAWVEATMRAARPVVNIAYRADAVSAAHALGYV